MENETVSDCIDGFLGLCSTISFYDPSSRKPAGSTQESSSQAPGLIILCTWLGGATTTRVRKYTAGYQHLFPNACILLIRTTLLDITLRSFQQIRARLAPARDVIQKVLARSSLFHESSDNSVLLHIFSHGGCNIALQLATSLHQDGTPLPLKCIVFDSCPGDATFQKAYDAAAVSLPAFQPVQWIGRVALYPAIGAITSLQNLGIVSSVKDLRSQLNDSHIFGSHARRLYLYSAGDRMVNYEDVQSHMAMARKLDYQVEGVLFKHAQHCALIMEDSGRYWAAIKEFWLGLDISDPEISLVSHSTREQLSLRRSVKL